ncbi:PEP-CTERM sorting domain-containing protein [Colwellia sp. MB3u-4]|uniref:PEP-CTERM sorting domain-containing protein n=1 Tax=Colwellia sp. MB3u-4 TaxID=2759822 RepID=UPI0015F448BF|nr:PEP-CTERM sorting domain-containing protein [Colwellia sp. MB3u-4]MBA6290416.1 PEP-CTERM sorting domain-containing protein [Colwellia sp. MB3u-4]
MKKLISTLIALSLAGSLSATVAADEFYIDIGTNNGGNSNTAAGDTTTGWLDQLSVRYESTSVITDGGTGAANSLSAGDTILSKGGVNNDNFDGTQLQASLTGNLINNFEPAQIGGNGPSNNGYLNGSLVWGLTFGFDDLVGSWNGTSFVYSGGTLSMYYFDNSMSVVSDLVRLFDLNVSSGGDTGIATVLNGTLGNFGALSAVNGVDAADVFNFALGSFGDLSGPPNNRTVSFNASQDTQPVGPLVFSGGSAETGATHNGSVNFTQVPEPTSLAILGLGLLGFAGARRRKAK